MDEYPFKFVAEHGADPGFGEVLEGLHNVISERAKSLAVPPISITVVLTNDLPASVAERGQPDFTAERLGGTVAGKTLPENPDYSSTSLIIGTAALARGDTVAVLHVLSTLGHEYAHALIGRLRATTDTEARSTDPPTPAEAAASIVQSAADEVRCNRFANNLFEGMTYSVDGGEQLPLHLGVLFGDSYNHEFGQCLRRVVYPGWPRLVTDYRFGNIDLGEMYRKLLRETWELFVLAAHSDSIAEVSGNPGIVSQFADEPAMNRYVGPAWAPVMAALAGQEEIPHLDSFAVSEAQILEAAYGVVDMWAQLGVTGRRLESGGLYLDVESPAA